MHTYFAAIHKDEDSDFGVSFPDVAGCYTAGSTLAEAEAMAREALAAHLEFLKDEGRPLPECRPYLEVLDEVREDAGFVALLLVVVPEKVKRVRLNVSFTEADLDIIDRAAEERHLDRSAFLAMAAKKVASGACEVL
ncbi:type II toxin-antitoxin system HicB family antitoxin [Megalodesulfovibrio gigas]|uniref:HicB-like antitoxin of toxin-antitoxin system domain-containing protein n=1 Tax=Megalodesulfovibrio gigas (strain ATCC 19364 / DSM 1382 / NCIMB 9332 / VKM B-1759) TaxID=1121448 RepID=T2GE51_MEGG1|nr:type II toxin-antitoxin system HicB family antitoxin [Megalodesulfovibrio gigas]AGW14875.1 hypothetical protein DGI_3164 [Megalodesulfovibrio gigas DSM 1382 = ATCC 19364]